MRVALISLIVVFGFLVLPLILVFLCWYVDICFAPILLPIVFEVCEMLYALWSFMRALAISFFSHLAVEEFVLYLSDICLLDFISSEPQNVENCVEE